MVVWVVAWVVAAAGFVHLYVSLEQPAYPWDWGRNWRMYQALHNAIANWNFVHALDLIASVRVSDYNFVAILFLTPQSFLLGTGREAYILLVVLTFIFPLVFVANAFVSRRVLRENDEAALDAGFAFALGLLYTPFWPASLRGMIDVAGLIPLAMSMDLFLASRFMNESSVRAAIRCGVELWLAFLVRRWLVFSIFSLSAVSVAFGSLSALRTRASVPRLAIRYGQLTAAFVVCALIAQWGLVSNILSTNYHDVYSAYKQSTLAEDVVNNFRSFGGLNIALMLVGLAPGAGIAIETSAWILLAAILNVCSFSWVQTPGIQHGLGVSLFLYPLYLAGAMATARGLDRAFGHRKRVSQFAVLAALALNFAAAFPLFDWGVLEPATAILAPAKTPPLRLAHYESYRRLIDFLMGLPAPNRIAVFASRDELSDSLLGSLEPTLRPRLAMVSQVDLRDLFSTESLRVDYIVVSDPIRTMLRPDGQRTIVFPAQSLANREDIGEAFEKLPDEFELDGGFRAHVYKRTRPFQRGEVDAFFKKLYQFYPEWRALYENSLGKEILSARVSPDGGQAEIDVADSTTLRVRPEAGRPVTLDFGTPLSGLWRRVILRAKFADPKACAQPVGFSAFTSAGGRTLAQASAAAGQPGDLDLRGGTTAISVARTGASSCGEATLEFLAR